MNTNLEVFLFSSAKSSISFMSCAKCFSSFGLIVPTAVNYSKNGGFVAPSMVPAVWWLNSKALVVVLLLFGTKAIKDLLSILSSGSSGS